MGHVVMVFSPNPTHLPAPKLLGVAEEERGGRGGEAYFFANHKNTAHYAYNWFKAGLKVTFDKWDLALRKKLPDRAMPLRLFLQGWLPQSFQYYWRRWHRQQHGPQRWRGCGRFRIDLTKLHILCKNSKVCSVCLLRLWVGCEKPLLFLCAA